MLTTLVHSETLTHKTPVSESQELKEQTHGPVLKYTKESILTCCSRILFIGKKIELDSITDLTGDHKLQDSQRHSSVHQPLNTRSLSPSDCTARTQQKSRHSYPYRLWHTYPCGSAGYWYWDDQGCGAKLLSKALGSFERGLCSCFKGDLGYQL